jgi:hypothetical protein
VRCNLKVLGFPRFTLDRRILARYLKQSARVRELGGGIRAFQQEFKEDQEMSEEVEAGLFHQGATPIFSTQFLGHPCVTLLAGKFKKRGWYQ